MSEQKEIYRNRDKYILTDSPQIWQNVRTGRFSFSDTDDILDEDEYDSRIYCSIALEEYTEALGGV